MDRPARRVVVGVTEALNWFGHSERPTYIADREFAMNNVTESAVSKGALLQQLFKIGFLAAVTVAMIGWASAIGWVIVGIVSWLFA